MPLACLTSVTYIAELIHKHNVVLKGSFALFILVLFLILLRCVRKVLKFPLAAAAADALSIGRRPAHRPAAHDKHCLPRVAVA